MGSVPVRPNFCCTQRLFSGGICRADRLDCEIFLVRAWQERCSGQSEVRLWVLRRLGGLRLERKSPSRAPNCARN
ncbi:unnamed protein product [Protopolystoma xenopodis]|uniref:Uncharacterized protein n=1 Tax=Protopolystoma xenopodis TaxID=117903 RepID=A0A3S5BIY6_9PLAT|nr:unnamed protein product [Protopolystoma xenopodis]